MTAAVEPPHLNEHDEPECPYDGTLLDLYSDGTWHCWKCGTTWDVDHVRDSPVWRTRTVAPTPRAATLTDHTSTATMSQQGAP